MTVGEAMERAEELRPGSRIALSTRQAWLREADAMLRERFFKHSITDAYDNVGADLAWDDSLIDYLVEKGYSVTYGARNLRRMIQKEIEDVVAEKLIEKRGKDVGTVKLSADGGRVTVDC